MKNEHQGYFENYISKSFSEQSNLQRKKYKFFKYWCSIDIIYR